MNELDRKKALEILELQEDATKDDVSKRYGILTRKFRSVEKDERGYTIEDITRAYNMLMGITYIDKNEEERQKALRENPPFLAKVFKVDPIKLENFFHYYKLHMLISIVVIVVLFFSIRSCVTQIPADFTIICYGKIYCQDQAVVENDVKQRLPDSAAPSVQFLSSLAEDPQYQYASQMKFVAMIAAQEVDIVIMDKENFDIHLKQGMFLSLDDFISEIGLADESYIKGSEIVDETEDGKLIEGPLHAYGIDITDNKFIKDNNVYAESAILAIVRNTEKIDRALEFISSLSN